MPCSECTALRRAQIAYSRQPILGHLRAARSGTVSPLPIPVTTDHYRFLFAPTAFETSRYLIHGGSSWPGLHSLTRHGPSLEQQGAAASTGKALLPIGTPTPVAQSVLVALHAILLPTQEAMAAQSLCSHSGCPACQCSGREERSGTGIHELERQGQGMRNAVRGRRWVDVHPLWLGAPAEEPGRCDLMCLTSVNRHGFC